MDERQCHACAATTLAPVRRFDVGEGVEVIMRLCAACFADPQAVAEALARVGVGVPGNNESN
jgi:hypothetical protein